jgi:Family of unknown function (DUF6011)
MNNLYRPNEALDALRIQAELETAHSTQTRRPTWAPAMVLDGELLALCREVGHLSADDKPVTRLWGIFADPKGRGTAIRTTFSSHALPGIRCRGFEMRAGVAHNGGRMTAALMDNDGTWSVGNNFRWGHSDISKMRYWVSVYENRITSSRRALEPSEPPLLTSPEQFYEWAMKRGESPEEARRSMEYAQQRNAADLARWEEREKKKRDPEYIETIRSTEEITADLLAKLREKIAKEEANPDWRYKALTRMTELATQRLLRFVGDPGTERVRGSHITGTCCCCGKLLTDKISVERGIGPECVRYVRIFDLRNLVRLKTEMVAAHPNKGG